MSKYTPEYWRPLFVAADAPEPDALVAWIREESDGSPAALGSVYEVGIFQIDLQDGPAWGASVESLHGTGAFTSSASSQTLTRELTDAEEALQVSSGIAYVKHCLSVAQSALAKAGASWSDDEVWNLVKMCHALPGLVVFFVPAAAQAGAMYNWGEYRSFVESLSKTDAAAINSNTARYYPFTRFFDNSERVGAAVAGGGLGAPGAAELEILLVLAIIGFALTRYV